MATLHFLFMKEIFYKFNQFEYKLDALILDIKSVKISIYNVPIKEITDQFLALLNEAKEELEIADLTFFYYSVSQLLYIKITMLLPVKIEYDDDEEALLRERVIDALENLKFSKYARLLDKYKEDNSMDFHRFELPFKIPFTEEELFNDIRLSDLALAYRSLMTKATSFSFSKKISAAQKYALLLELFEKNDRIKFTDLIGDTTSAQHIVAAFMAVLDAINRGVCDFIQEKIYDEIILIKLEQDFSQTEEL